MFIESIIKAHSQAGLSYQQITFLTFQAVVEVVIICLAGFWAARTGLLNNEATKVVSRLNVDLFTPALIFTKLASSLSLKKLLEVIIIPMLFVMVTGVSYCCSIWMSTLLKLSESESNFVTAMAVFGNSNSLPVSLTLALSYTLPGLEWEDVEDDTPDQIASRGLIYLLIFQQLGQMLRWSWGYNKLLKKQSKETLYGVDHPFVQRDIEQHQSLLGGENNSNRPISYGSNEENDEIDNNNNTLTVPSQPIVAENQWSEGSSMSSNLSTNKSVVEERENDNQETSGGEVTTIGPNIFKRIYSAMNPPLWAMLVSVIVASVPQIRYEFYESNGFVQNTFSKSISQLGSVSIPLILVVLGANLAPSSEIPPACPNYSKMIFGSLVSRMVLPSIILLPIITLSTKWIGLSILDDPIFLITSFLLITSPPAIQLSQICQLNEIYQKEMAGVLFYGYVILTLPVTIVIVVSSLECLKWALGE
ncbi:hypothetical protein CANARDRAFT_5988 [[Candida] arabinofermentans NRRL YB-2248]|uniref:Auxin efflux carrier n=1 Tax=[Candida] arabinofermentans NRRL YB-2248 TaxID=983967 RepID=A0A1E4T6U2_9ASCO|nr:hypothetical protein CANARDRAFT_5988 [[Candida] arabinofermentans NRRL YB-2248]